MKWHPNALTAGCRKSAQQLKTFPWLNDFYLAGGTALALRYGHRVSVDLDFFSHKNVLDFSGREPLLEGLETVGARVEEQKDGALHAHHDGTHISFFRYRYPLLQPVYHWEGIQIASPLDIGLMKIGAIIGRGTKKDFVDLYTLVKNGVPLAKLLRQAPKKFSTGEDFRVQACRALVYFADAEKEPPLHMLSSTPWVKVKQFFEGEVRKLSRPFQH